MQSALKLAQSRSLPELKTLAIACGIASSGTKASIAERLEASVQSVKQNRGSRLPSEQRILSIDMGIRNLAFAFLTPPSINTQTLAQDARTPIPGVAVTSWNRIVLADPANGPNLPADEEVWSPENMSNMTLKLVHEHFLGRKEPPTHILIERQRFRSGGGSAVQEWTLRVNTLEAMIYSTLKTLGECGRWKGEIIPILPRRVGPFWLEGIVADDVAKAGEDKVLKSSKNSKAKAKKAKIDLVGNWLLEGKINPTDEAHLVAKSYLERWQGKRATNKSKEKAESTEERLKKLDDLADSLLQGLAWIKWQNNIDILAAEGPDALLNP